MDNVTTACAVVVAICLLLIIHKWMNTSPMKISRFATSDSSGYGNSGSDMRFETQNSGTGMHGTNRSGFYAGYEPPYTDYNVAELTANQQAAARMKRSDSFRSVRNSDILS